MSTDDQERARAIERIRARRELMRQAATFAAVSVLLLAIWFFTNLNSDDDVFFWPVFPIAGMGLALAAEWWHLRDEDRITEDEIRREVERRKT